MSEDAEAHSHQNIQHNGETYIKLADAAVTFRHLRAEITRLRAEIATARRDAMEEAAQRAFEYARTAWQHGSLPVDPDKCAAQVAREIAGSIAALAGVKPGEHLSEAEQERDVFFNRLGRITEHFRLPVDATAQRIIEAIQERIDNEREACASVEVRLTVPEGAETWTPLEAWEEALLAFDEAFRDAIRAAAGEVK